MSTTGRAGTVDYRAMYEREKAVVDGIRRHAETMLLDRRMKVMGEILLREIARLEAEADAR